MSSYFQHPADLATFGDLDAVLNKIGDITLREPVRQYYRVLHWVQQIRSAKWCLFTLFVTTFISLELEVLFPKSLQWQAVIVLCIAIIVLAIMTSMEKFFLVFGGDPAELFETRDEELAIASELSHIAQNAFSMSSSSSGGKFNKAVTLRPNSNLGALFVVPESEASSSGAVHYSSSPLAKINKSAPKSPITLSALPTVPRTVAAANSPVRQVRSGLLNFNAKRP